MPCEITLAKLSPPANEGRFGAVCSAARQVVFLKENASGNLFFILRFCSPGNILCKLCTPFALEHFLCLLSLLQRYHTHKVNLRTLHFAKLLSLQRKMLWLIFISEHWHTESRRNNKHINIAQTLRLKAYQPNALKNNSSPTLHLHWEQRAPLWFLVPLSRSLFTNKTSQPEENQTKTMAVKHS